MAYALFGTMVMLPMLVLACLLGSVSGNFNEEFDITWGDDRAKILNNGEALTLSLDKNSGSGFQSKNEYLYGKFDIQLKLVPGNSAGTVSTYYLSSQGLNHDEIDFEFLGNLSGDPYIVHTNVYSQGKGDREQQFYLWFDPTQDFHTYSILWNPLNIVFYVDNTPIREFKNSEATGVPYLNKQPMRVYSSLWDAEDWATRGGLIKTDWTQAPFITSFQNFKADACIQSSASSSSSPCSSLNSSTSSSPDRTWLNQELDLKSKKRLRRVQKKFMIYNYCTDSKRFPQGFPLNAARNLPSPSLVQFNSFVHIVRMLCAITCFAFIFFLNKFDHFSCTYMYK